MSIKIVTALTLASLLLTTSGVFAGDLSTRLPHLDRPGSTEAGGGSSGDGGGRTHPGEPPTTTPTHGRTGGPIDSDDTPPGDGGGNGGGDGPSTHPMSDDTPTGEMSCFYFGDWELNGVSYNGAFLTNTGGTVIHAGSIVRFMVDGQIVEMTIPFDVVPGGQWSWFVDGDPNYSFPAGIEVPVGSTCDAELILA